MKEIAAVEKQNSENKASVKTLQTRSFQLNYAKVRDGVSLIQEGATVLSTPHQNTPRLLSARGHVVAEPRTNQLFVTDIADHLNKIQTMIAQLHVPLQQVLIEARIVQPNHQFGASLGSRLGVVDQGARGVLVGNKFNQAVSNTRLQGAPQTIDTISQMINFPTAGFQGDEPAAFALSLFNADKTRFIAWELSAMEAPGQGQVVSHPKVVTANQVKAIIEQGTELPHQVTSTKGASSIAFRKANLKLEVTPHITPDGSIIMDLDPTKGGVGQSSSAGFAIDTKHINTQLRIEDGGNGADWRHF
ncbi:MAG: hypothetical protein EXR35_09385 [Limnohabitans sp.]|nr:hypothetical protein [Limnohabitans sp.]